MDEKNLPLFRRISRVSFLHASYLHVITVAGGSDGVEAVGVGLAVLGVDARWDDTVGLALPVGPVDKEGNDYN